MGIKVIHGMDEYKSEKQPVNAYRRQEGKKGIVWWVNVTAFKSIHHAFHSSARNGLKLQDLAEEERIISLKVTLQLGMLELLVWENSIYYA